MVGQPYEELEWENPPQEGDRSDDPNQWQAGEHPASTKLPGDRGRQRRS